MGIIWMEKNSLSSTELSKRKMMVNLGMTIAVVIMMMMVTAMVMARMMEKMVHCKMQTEKVMTLIVVTMRI